MRTWMMLICVAALAAGRISQAQTPAPPLAPAPFLSPAISEALRQLAAPDFATREKAAAELQFTLGQTLGGMMQARDAAARGELLAFERGLCAWAADVLKRPRDQQQAAVEFGLMPEVLPQVVGLYSKDKAVRAGAVMALRKNADPRVMDLLATALEDPEPAVYVPAMEGVYDRPPTQAVVDALWQRAVAAMFLEGRQAPAVAEVVTFRGQPVQGKPISDFTWFFQTRDSHLAGEVLLHLKPPQLTAKLKALFEEAAAAYAKPDVDGKMDDELLLYMGWDTMDVPEKLAAGCKPAEIVPALYLIATGPSHFRTAHQSYFTSSRTWAIALVVEVTGQTPADWKLFTMPKEVGPQWLMPTEDEENAAIAKLKEWWGKEHDKYGTGPDTRPALPVEPPAPITPIFHGRMG